MPKALSLKLAGLWTAPNDYTSPEGALDIFDNCNIDQKDLGESRRGFEIHIDNSAGSLDGFPVQTMTATNVSVMDPDLLIYRLDRPNSDGRLLLDDVDSIAGNNRFLPPTSARRPRMMPWGVYTYITSNIGVQRYSRGLNSAVSAGIPQALDLVLTLDGTSGYLTSNEVASIGALVTAASPTLAQISNTDIESFFIGQVITGTGIAAGTLVQDVTLSVPVVIYAASIASGSTTISIASNAGVAAGQIVSGQGIQPNARVVSISGAGPYSVVLSLAAIETAAAQTVTFSSDNTVTMSQNSSLVGAPAVETLSLSNGSQVAYRWLWGYRNENDAVMLGAPSSFTTISNTTGGTRNVQADTTIPEGITTDYFWQLYRSVATPSSSISPPDQMQLVGEGVPTSTDISNGFITVIDQTPDSLKGEALYTGSDVEGIGKANYRPPNAVDICTFRGHTIYLNVTNPEQLKLIMDGVGAPSGIQIGDAITIETAPTDTFTLTAAASENIVAGEFQIFSAGTPAQNIADTAASFVRVFNRYAANTIVYAYLISGPNDLPGQILFEARSGIGTFTVEANLNGTAWTPNIDTEQSSRAENIPNGLLVSKPQEPEAVPRTNLFRAGGLGNTCIRAVPLRDYVVVITTDGIFRLTGQTLNDFVVEPFDLTVQIIGPETAVALGNECWALSTQGVVSISDGGVRIRSAIQINDIIQSLIRQAPLAVANVSFGLGYEADQRYVLALPDSEGDAFSVQELCYNYITDRWSRWTRFATAGYINRQTGMYLANAGNSNIVLERKNGDFTDYVDESLFRQVASSSALTVTLDDVNGITAGDILWQFVDGIARYAEITAIDIPAGSVTVNQVVPWVAGTATEDTRVLQAIACSIQWKPMAAGDPTEAKQMSEGQFVFRTAKFFTATARFSTDISPSFTGVPLLGNSGGGWGLFPWGEAPWGGILRPTTLRFYVPEDKQYGGVLITRLDIRSGYSNWKLEGGAITVMDIGFELGGPGSDS